MYHEWPIKKLLDKAPLNSNLNPLMCSVFLVMALTEFSMTSKDGGLLGFLYLPGIYSNCYISTSSSTDR